MYRGPVVPLAMFLKQILEHWLPDLLYAAFNANVTLVNISGQQMILEELVFIGRNLVSAFPD